LYADSFELWSAFISYSYTYEFSEGKNISKHSIGQEWGFYTPISFNNDPMFYITGIHFKWGDNGNSINANNILHFNLYKYLEYSWAIDLVSGFNFSFNFDKGIIGFSPEIGFSYRNYNFNYHINISYRYNIYSTVNNTHEIVFTIGIMDFIQTYLIRDL
jgi:hypothetical protein